MSNKDCCSQLLKLLETPGLASIGPDQRTPVMPLAELQQNVSTVLAGAGLPDKTQSLILATIMVWHDHLDEAHTIAQNIENASGSLLHAIIHRREPDYFNSGYWLRRVGNHPSYQFIKEPPGSPRALFPNGRYDPMAMNVACEKALQSRAPEPIHLLQQIQKSELTALIRYLCPT